MRPSPPAAVTAAASFPPAAVPIGASTIGCSMPSRSVSRVEIPMMSSAAAQGERLLVEHRLDRRPRGAGIEPMPVGELLAIGRDRVDVLRLLEPLELVGMAEA